MEKLQIIKSNFSLEKYGFENLERKWGIEEGGVKKKKTPLGKSLAKI